MAFIEKAQMEQENCVGCGACIEACPAKAIYMQPGWRCAVQQTACIGCGKCAALCHRGAPYMVPVNM